MTNTSVNCMKCHLSIIKWWDFNKHLLGFRCVSIPVFLFPSFSSTVGQMECKRKYHAHRRPFTHTLWWNHVMLFHNVITLHLGLWHKWKEYSGNYQYFHRTGKCERWDDGNWKYWRPTYSSCFEEGGDGKLLNWKREITIFFFFIRGILWSQRPFRWSMNQILKDHSWLLQYKMPQKDLWLNLLAIILFELPIWTLWLFLLKYVFRLFLKNTGV